VAIATTLVVVVATYHLFQDNTPVQLEDEGVITKAVEAIETLTVSMRNPLVTVEQFAVSAFANSDSVEEEASWISSWYYTMSLPTIFVTVAGLVLKGASINNGESLD
jgi:hypothetical protein